MITFEVVNEVANEDSPMVNSAKPNRQLVHESPRRPRTLP
jgi:hypothetical protein